jgi:ribosomal protein L11 methyltransferase
MWRQLSVATAAALADPVADFLSRLGALSVSFEDEGDQPLFEPKPGETPVWNQTRIIALLESETDTALIRAGLVSRFGAENLSAWRVEELADQDWERTWLEHFEPMRFGRRLWICPTDFPSPADPDAVCVRLDPGLAFGTGTHPTTALCLEWLDSQDLRGKVVIDYGCGSGILAVAALLLGAQVVHAVDIDPQALTATRDNARKNHVEQRIFCTYPGDLPDLRADVLLANILANPLVELEARFARRVRADGFLVLSGILKAQVSDVMRAYEPHFRMQPPAHQEDWARLTGTRRAN